MNLIPPRSERNLLNVLQAVDEPREHGLSSPTQAHSDYYLATRHFKVDFVSDGPATDPVDDLVNARDRRPSGLHRRLVALLGNPEPPLHDGSSQRNRVVNHEVEAGHDGQNAKAVSCCRPDEQAGLGELNIAYHRGKG